MEDLRKNICNHKVTSMLLPKRQRQLVGTFHQEVYLIVGSIAETTGPPTNHNKPQWKEEYIIYSNI